MADYTSSEEYAIPSQTQTYRIWKKNYKPVVFYTESGDTDPVIFYTESGDTDPVIFYERAEFNQEKNNVIPIESLYVFAGEEGFNRETYAIPAQTLGYTAALEP